MTVDVGNKSFKTTRLSEYVLNKIDDIFFGFTRFYSPDTKKEIHETEDIVRQTYLTATEKITLTVEKIK